MADKLILEAEVPVECHVMQAGISRASRASYVLPILIHVQELSGKATPESLANELFAGLRPLSQKLLDICYDSKLVDIRHQRYALTEEGRSAIDNERIFVSKEKMWKIYYSPLRIIPDTCSILKLEDGRREARFRKEDPAKPEQPKKHIIELTQKIMTTSFGEKQDFRINDITGLAKTVKSDMRATLCLEINRKGSILSLSSAGEGAPLEGPDITYREAWDQLLEEKGIGGWDYENDRLQISYDDTKPEERSRMKTVLNFEPRMLGTEFNPLQKTVSIYPGNQYDARRWADDLFMDKVRDYVTREEYQKITEEIKAQFPDFEVSFKGRAEYIAETERGSPKFWYMQAAEDWKL